MFSPDEIERMTPQVREELQLWLLERHFAQDRAKTYAQSRRGIQPSQPIRRWPRLNDVCKADNSLHLQMCRAEGRRPAL